MYFELERPYCPGTGNLCKHIFILRGYDKKNKARYFGVTTVIQRDDGLWEPTAWMTNNKAPKDYPLQGMRFLTGMGLRISGTFETHRLAAYKRMFRGHYDLKTIEIRKKYYNGKELEFAYVEFKPRQGVS